VFIATAIGAIIGAYLRYGFSQAFQSYSSMSEHENLILGSVNHLQYTGIKQFPFGTFVANTLGAFFMGIFFEVLSCKYFHQRPVLQAHLRAGILTGFMGTLTTMSSFAFECALLFQRTSIAKFAEDSYQKTANENPTENFVLNVSESSSVWVAWVYIISTLAAGIVALYTSKTLVLWIKSRNDL
jgi:fluoride ion exporter CrcB/FEX